MSYDKSKILRVMTNWNLFFFMKIYLKNSVIHSTNKIFKSAMGIFMALGYNGPVDFKIDVALHELTLIFK